MSIKKIFKCYVMYTPNAWEECPMTADLLLQQEREAISAFPMPSYCTDLCHLEVESDDPDIHPPKFCNSCYLAMQRMRKSLDERKVYRTSLVGHVWSVHSNDVCETYDMVNKTLGRARDPRANGAWLSKLTE